MGVQFRTNQLERGLPATIRALRSLQDEAGFVKHPAFIVIGELCLGFLERHPARLQNLRIMVVEISLQGPDEKEMHGLLVARLIILQREPIPDRRQGSQEQSRETCLLTHLAKGRGFHVFIGLHVALREGPGSWTVPIAKNQTHFMTTPVLPHDDPSGADLWSGIGRSS